DLNNEEWLGLSFGSRRPFIPQDGIAYLGNENYKEIEYKVYPNPTSNYITIELDEEINEVLLYTTSGSQIMSSTSKELNITHLPNGVYLMKDRKSTRLNSIHVKITTAVSIIIIKNYVKIL